jgi:hypothetical protein
MKRSFGLLSKASAGKGDGLDYAIEIIICKGSRDDGCIDVLYAE